MAYLSIIKLYCTYMEKNLYWSTLIETISILNVELDNNIKSPSQKEIGIYDYI